MTREEAIEALNEIFDESEYSRYDAWYGTAMDMAIKALEQPEQKKGKWEQYWGKYLKCSSCDNITAFATPYCPWCGLKMEGEE